jgi:Zn-dependent protease
VAHEYAHGYAAFTQGDDTALEQGRLTFNPIAHIDLWMTILLPALLWYSSGGRFIFGGAKPIPVRPDKYRNYRSGDIIVSLAGVVTNLAIGLVCLLAFVLLGLIARGVPDAAGVIVTGQRMLSFGVWFNLMLCFFNLIPIPPLDGSHVLYHFLPQGIRERYRSLQRLGILPLLALMVFFPKALQMLLIPAQAAMGLFVRIATPFAAGEGWNIFQA